MDQLQKIFRALSVAQRAGIAGAVLLLIAGITSFVHWRRESDFRPLFTGMPPEDAASIVQKLKESGVEHRLSDNGTSVLVPAARVDDLRLEMAGAGLPRSGRIGFELFDKANLGITDFTEHINYRRALEGELERSIRSLNEVEQARIHISFPKESVFLDAREPAKASVLLTLRPGARLSDSNIGAITNLVASAVEGLSPEFVSVVDMRGNLLNRPKKPLSDSSDGSDAALEYKHQLEKDLFAKVESTLIPLLGEDHFRVGISADCDFSTSEQTDETFDPTRSVMTNSQKSEDLASKPDSAGIPGTPSNLPRPVSRPAISAGSVSRRTENVAYETSRSVRQVKVPRGILKRLSASILVDQDVRWVGIGSHAKRVTTPPSPEEMKTIHDVVAGIIGLSVARGDQLIVESLPFEQNHEPEFTPQAPSGPVSQKDELRKLLTDPKVMIGGGVAALLVLGLAVFASTRKRKKRIELAQSRTHLLAGQTAENAGTEKEIAAQNEKAQLEANAHGRPQLAEASSKIEGLRQNIRETVSRDPALAAGVIRTWIAETER
ncbi:MAG: flagellar M-ring protein FliF [Acidobacteriaceae bacterium]|nr:flagellar M-ring protein FliF [Acidobacteriaceae bacterium]